MKQRHTRNLFFLALSLGLALSMTPQVLNAQDTSTTSPSTTNTANAGTDRDTHRGFDWGWLGLLGLAGLAGLRRKPDVITTTDTRR